MSESYTTHQNGIKNYAVLPSVTKLESSKPSTHCIASYERFAIASFASSNTFS